MTTTLYRLYDEADNLLYIGIAGNPGRRFEQHRGEKPWWGEVARTTLTHYATRQEALYAELSAINTEHPRHNIIGNKRSAERSTDEWEHLVRLEPRLVALDDLAAKFDPTLDHYCNLAVWYGFGRHWKDASWWWPEGFRGLKREMAQIVGWGRKFISDDLEDVIAGRYAHQDPGGLEWYDGAGLMSFGVAVKEVERRWFPLQVEKPDEKFLRSMTAYSVAYDHLFKALPSCIPEVCRSCW
jgi:predicted GIY-YIG superfamily endonuclease